jgi:hypothetical protein
LCTIDERLWRRARLSRRGANYVLFVEFLESFITAKAVIIASKALNG